MYWEIEFRDNGGNTFNYSTEKYKERNDAITNLYAFYMGERDVMYDTITGIALVEVDENENSCDECLIIREDEDDNWEFDDEKDEIAIKKAVENYFLYLRKKIKVCNFSCQDEEDSYYLLENII